MTATDSFGAFKPESPQNTPMAVRQLRCMEFRVEMMMKALGFVI